MDVQADHLNALKGSAACAAALTMIPVFRMPIQAARTSLLKMSALFNVQVSSLPASLT